MDVTTMQSRGAADRPSWNKPQLQSLAREVESATVHALMAQLADSARECGTLQAELTAARNQIAALDQALRVERERPAVQADPETANTLRAIQASVDKMLEMEATEIKGGLPSAGSGEDGDDAAEAQSLARIESMLQQLLAREVAEPPELGDMRFEFVRDAANLPIAIVYKP